MFTPHTRRILVAGALVALLLVSVSSALAAAGARSARGTAAGGVGNRHINSRRRSPRPRHKQRRSAAGLAVPAPGTVLLGETAVQQNWGALRPGRAEAFAVRARTTGPAEAAHLYIGSNNTATTVIVGLYANASGHPGALLSSGSAPASSPGSWTTIALQHFELYSGANYWLAIMGSGGTLGYRDRTGGQCASQISLQTSLSAMPTGWRTATSRDGCPVSAYLTVGDPLPAAEPPAPEAAAEITTPQIVVKEEATTLESPPSGPVNTEAPVITGSAVEGQTLSTSNGGWSSSPTSYTYQWEDCDVLGEGCLSISGASGASYELTPSDVGSVIRAVVTAANADGSGIGVSAPSATVLPFVLPPPVNTSLPLISGTAVEGETLKAGNGSWTNSPTSFTYQWKDCNTSGESCSNISGASSSTYKLAGSDVGHTLHVAVTATNAGGSTKATSAASATVLPQAPVNTSPPTISGTPEEGRTLNVSTGSWTNSPTSHSYQWEDCNGSGESCSAIAGATASSYGVVSRDVGETIRATVTATNAGGSRSATAEATQTVIAEPPAPPVNTSLPVISGSTEEGRTLSATEGSWSGSGISFTYQWEDCNTGGGSCSAIPGASSSTYKLATGDVGHTVRFAVTATNPSGSATATSSATALITPPPPANTTPPSISGVAEEGRTLTASSGTWSNSPTSFAYQWKDCNTSGESCSNISGASSSTYKLAGSDVGHTLRVAVTATNAGGSGSATSAASAPVVAQPPSPPVNTALPSISGTPVEGSTLSASEGSWSNSPTSFKYQWKDCNTSGESCSNISGASSSTYKLATGDVGHTVRVAVTATNAGGSAEATSGASSTVSEAAKGTPKNCFENPESEGTSRFEACGYPGPKDTGVAEVAGKTECSSLPTYTGSLTSIPEGTTIAGKDIKVTLTSAFASGMQINSKNVKITGSCILVKGGEFDGPAIYIGEDANSFSLTNSTVRGENATTESYEEAIRDESGAPGTLKIEHSRIEDCGECLHGEPIEATGSYIIANENVGKSGGLHREPWYANNGTVIARNDTILVPEDQTAVIFDNVANGTSGVEACSNHVTLESSLLAGSGQMVQTCGPRATGPGTATLTVKDNRFARCLTTPVVEKRCSGSGTEGSDAHGYFPAGGWISLLGEAPYGTLIWEGNFWDDNLESVGS